MEPQPQAARSQESEQTATNAANAEQQPQAASSAVAAQAGASTTTAEQQPQAASSSEADQPSDIAAATENSRMDKVLSFGIKYFFPGVIASWLLLLILGIIFAICEKSEALGQLGDSFGILNTLFSGLAFLGIIISIKLQRDDLKLQREELARQGNEMQSQRELAEEYQSERFFVLLLEQIKGSTVATSEQNIINIIESCYSYQIWGHSGIDQHTFRKNLTRYIKVSYSPPSPNNAQDPPRGEINSFLTKIPDAENGKFQLLFERFIHIHEFILSLSSEKTRNNYAKIVYTNIGRYDRIIIFMYLVAQFKLQKGDILGDLLLNDYMNLGPL